MTIDSTTDFSPLVREGGVHSAVYTDETVFEVSLRGSSIETRVYLAHESSSSQGDYCTKWIGTQQVIVVRDSDGEIHGFFNRCRHTRHCPVHPGIWQRQFFSVPVSRLVVQHSRQARRSSIPEPLRSRFQEERTGLGSAAPV